MRKSCLSMLFVCVQIRGLGFGVQVLTNEYCKLQQTGDSSAAAQGCQVCQAVQVAATPLGLPLF